MEVQGACAACGAAECRSRRVWCAMHTARPPPPATHSHMRNRRTVIIENDPMALSGPATRHRAGDAGKQRAAVNDFRRRWQRAALQAHGVVCRANAACLRTHACALCAVCGTARDCLCSRALTCGSAPGP
jgi:hypothetical protein